MTFSTLNKIPGYLSIAYFVFVCVEIIAELFEYRPLLVILKILAPSILVVLYNLKSHTNNPLFFSIILLQLINNTFFLYITSDIFIYIMLCFILMRIISLILVFRLTKRNNYLYITVATFPFLLIFFYLISITSEIPEYEFNLLVIQSILISLLGGVSIVNYLKSDNVRNSWLLISTLLYMGLRFLVFIERYFLPDNTLLIYRPIEVFLTSFALYSFYKYVLAAESASKNNFNIHANVS